MKRADFIFAVGFDGSRAVVDKRSRAKYAALDTRSLADRGLFPAALRSAVFEGSDENARYVLEKYSEVSSVQYTEAASLAKVFGIQPPSEDITGIRAV